MNVGSRLREALIRINTASSNEALRDGLADAASQMDFAYFALVQHGGLPRLIDSSILGTNYPEEFVRFYLDNHYYIIDPVYEVSQQLDRPFCWQEIVDFAELAENQLALFEEARRYGIAHGVTVPLHIPSEPHASCTFARREPIEITPSLMTTLHIIAGFAFKVGLNLHQPLHGRDIPRLTRREAQCTALIAVGKSDWEMGEILGLGETTIRYFVSQAKRKYGVYKRSELVARAIVDAQAIRDGQSENGVEPQVAGHKSSRR